MTKKILIVNWGTKDKQYVFAAAKKKNLDIFVATSPGYPRWLHTFVPRSHIILADTYDSELLLMDILAYMNVHNVRFDGITTFFEMNIIQTADVATALGLPFLSPAAARRSSNNKLMMRYWCQKHHVPTPQFQVFRTVNEGLGVIKKIKPPVILKPIKSGHSYGVIKIDKTNQNDYKNNFLSGLREARNQLDTVFDEWMEKWPYKGYFLIEEYLDGRVVSIDGLIHNGKEIFSGIADFDLSRPPLMLEQKTYIPSRLPATAQRHCLHAARRIVKTLGFDNCGFHCEMKYTDKGPVLLEAAARLPGGQMLRGYGTAYQVDLAGLYLDICLGKSVKPIHPVLKQYVLQESIPFQKPGIVTAVSGLAKALKMDACTVFSACKPGDETMLSEKVAAPALYYQVSGTSPGKRDQLQADIHSTFRVTIAPKQFPRQSFYRQKIKSAVKALHQLLYKSHSIIMNQNR